MTMKTSITLPDNLFFKMKEDVEVGNFSSVSSIIEIALVEFYKRIRTLAWLCAKDVAIKTKKGTKNQGRIPTIWDEPTNDEKEA